MSDGERQNSASPTSGDDGADADDIGDAEQRRLGHWGWLALGVAVVVGGRFLGPVGVDTSSLEELMPGAGTMASPLVGSSLGLLVTVRLVLAALRAESRLARIAAFVVYTGLTAMQGLAIALYLESLNGMLPWADVVSEPGWGFRLSTAASWAAGAVLLWWMADAIDQTRRAQGALFLWLASFVLETMLGAGAVGTSAAQLVELAPIAQWLVTPAAVAVVGLVMLARPGRFPRTLLRIELRSAWDVLALTAVATLPEQLLGGLAALAPEVLAGEWVSWLSLALAVVAGVALAVWTWRHAEAQRARPVEPAALALCAFVVPAGFVGYAFVAGGGIAALTAPPPLAGEASFTLVLDADESFGGGDAELMRARLETLGADATVVDFTPSQITLRVENALGQEAVLEAIAPHRLGLHVMGEGALSPSGLPSGLRLELGTVGMESAPQVVAGDCATAEEWSTSAQVPGCLLAVQRMESELEPDATDCRVHCLAPEPVITNTHVESAEVGFDTYGSGQPHVFVRLTEEGGARLGAATRTHLHEPLAIVLDGEAVSVPIVQSEIGREVQVSLGGLRDPREALVEAHALANALVSEATVAPFTLAEVRLTN